MIYQCIRCHVTWGEEAEGDDSFFSHGLCLDCLREALIPIYRKRQKLENNPDCFGKANDYCDQEKCAYRHLCLKKENK